MEPIRSLLLIVFGLAVGVVLSVLTCIYGWGLTPQNWWVIIGVGLFGQIFASAIIEIAKKKE